MGWRSSGYGLAPTLLAEKAIQSALTGRVMTIAPDEYM